MDASEESAARTEACLRTEDGQLEEVPDMSASGEAWASEPRERRMQTGTEACANRGADVVSATMSRDHHWEMRRVKVSADWSDRMATEAAVDGLAEGIRESCVSTWNQ